MTHEDISRSMAAEATRARDIYPPFNSPHEGYAVLLEEVRELEAEVFRNRARRSQTAMLDEALQVGAMAIRFIHDCCNVSCQKDA